MGVPKSGWTLSIGFVFTAIDDDTTVHAVCKHSRGFFSFGLFFRLLLFFCSATRGNSPLRGQVCMRHFPFVSDGSIFLKISFSDAFDVITVHCNFLPTPPLVKQKYADFFLNVISKTFLSGYISLYQASRISRPPDVALTICQCGQRFCVSILFFFKEPTFLEQKKEKRKRKEKCIFLSFFSLNHQKS